MAGVARSDPRGRRRAHPLPGGLRERLSPGATCCSWTGSTSRSILGQAGAALPLLHRGLLLQRPLRPAGRAELQPLRHAAAAVLRRRPDTAGGLLHALPGHAGIAEGRFRLEPARERGPAPARCAPSATRSCGAGPSPTECSSSAPDRSRGASSRRSSPGRTFATPSWAWSTTAMASDATGLPYPVLGPLERLDKIIDEVKPDRLIVALHRASGPDADGPAPRVRGPGHPRGGRAGDLRVTSPGSCRSRR